MAAAPIARQVFDYYLLGKMPTGPAPTEEHDETVAAASVADSKVKR